MSTKMLAVASLLSFATVNLAQAAEPAPAPAPAEKKDEKKDEKKGVKPVEKKDDGKGGAVSGHDKK